LSDLAYSGALLPTPTPTPYGNNQSNGPNATVRPSLDSLFTEGSLSEDHAIMKGETEE
jgi:hypothetical protein